MPSYETSLILEQLKEKIEMLELQNKHLNNKIKDLEQRIVALEISRRVGF